jgi:hypothetical protein
MPHKKRHAHQPRQKPADHKPAAKNPVALIVPIPSVALTITELFTMLREHFVKKEFAEEKQVFMQFSKTHFKRFMTRPEFLLSFITQTQDLVAFVRESIQTITESGSKLLPLEYINLLTDRCLMLLNNEQQQHAATQNNLLLCAKWHYETCSDLSGIYITYRYFERQNPQDAFKGARESFQLALNALNLIITQRQAPGKDIVVDPESALHNLKYRYGCFLNDMGARQLCSGQIEGAKRDITTALELCTSLRTTTSQHISDDKIQQLWQKLSKNLTIAAQYAPMPNAKETTRSNPHNEQFFSEYSALKEKVQTAMQSPEIQTTPLRTLIRECSQFVRKKPHSGLNIPNYRDVLQDIQDRIIPLENLIEFFEEGALIDLKKQRLAGRMAVASRTATPPTKVPQTEIERPTEETPRLDAPELLKSALKHMAMGKYPFAKKQLDQALELTRDSDSILKGTCHATLVNYYCSSAVRASSESLAADLLEQAEAHRVLAIEQAQAIDGKHAKLEIHY